MNWQKVVLFLIAILIFAAAIPALILAENETDIDLEVLTPVQKTAPGETLNLLCELSNTGHEKATVSIKLEMPRTWKQLIPTDRIAIPAGSKETLIIPVFSSKNSRAGSYTLPVKCKMDAGPVLISKEFIVNIEKVNLLTADCFKSPQYAVSGEEYWAEFTVCNGGNTDRCIKFKINDNLDLSLKLSCNSLKLKAGESKKISVRVTIPQDFHKNIFHHLQLTAAGKKGGTVTATSRVKIIPKQISNSNIYHTYPLKLTIGKKSKSKKLKWLLQGKGNLGENSCNRLSFRLNNRRNYIRYSSPLLNVNVDNSDVSLSPLTVLNDKNYVKITREGEKQRLKLFYCNDKTWGVKEAWKLNENNRIGVQYINLAELSNLLTFSNSFDCASCSDFTIEYGQHLGGDMSAENSMEESIPSALFVKSNCYFDDFNAHFYYRQEDKNFLGREEKIGKLRLFTEFPFFNSYQMRFGFLRNNDNQEIECKLSRYREDNYRGFKIKKSLSTESKYKYSIFCKGSLALSNIDFYQNLTLKSFLNDDDFCRYIFYDLYFYSLQENTTLGSYLNFEYPLWKKDSKKIGGGFYLQHHVDERESLRAGLSFENFFSQKWRFYIESEHKFDAGNMLTCRGEINNSNNSSPEIKTELAYTVPFALPLKRKSDLGVVAGYIKDDEDRGIKDAVIKLNGQTKLANKNGHFLFRAVPTGRHYLSVDKPRKYKEEYLILPSDLLAVNVKPEGKVEKKFTVVKGVDIKGEIIFLEGCEKNSLRESSIYGKKKIDKEEIYSGIIVELTQDDKMYRRTGNKKGKFEFNNLPPGKWQFKVYKNGLSDLYVLDPREKLICLQEGENRDLKIKITPVKREIQIQQGERVEYSF